MNNTINRMDEEQVLPPFWGTAVKLGPALIVAIFYLTIVFHYAYTPDDTYIYLQYARNLVHGNGFAFNFDSPSYGITAPLWVLLIAGGAKAGLDPFVVAKTFDIVFASMSVVLVYTLSFTIVRDKIYALFAALVFSFDGLILRWAGSGTETSFAVLLVLLVVKYAYLGDYHIAGLVAGLLTLVCPEGVLLFLVIQIENFIVSVVLGRDKRLLWTSTLLYALIVVPWLIFSFVSFGSIIPNEVSLSLRGILGGIFNSAIVLGLTLPLPTLLLIVGVPVVIRKAGIGTFIAKGMPIIWIVGLIFGSQQLHARVASPYLVPAISLIILYAFWCLRQMEEFFRWSRKKSVLALSILSIATILQSEFIYWLKFVPQMKSLTERMEKGIRPIALWLRSNSSDDSAVLTQDAGLLGYVGERKIFDTTGLITPAVKKAFSGASYDDGMRRELYRSVVKPEYVVDYASIRARLSSDSLLPILTTKCDDSATNRSGPVYYTLYRLVQ